MRASSSESGQAAVEAALTLPLAVFLFLGMLQMFLLAQGRVLTQVAAYRATRVGSTNHGHCGRMVHAALLSVLPSIDSFLGGPGGRPAEKLAAAFSKRRANRYDESFSAGGEPSRYSGSIVWIARERPTLAEVAAYDPDDIDQPLPPTRLETRLIFWFPLKVPFANWVLSRAWLAQYGLQAYSAQNPLLATQRAQWEQTTNGYRLDAAIARELLERAGRGEYVFPIEATSTMRMMSPPKAGNFGTQNCAPTPEVLR